VTAANAPAQADTVLHVTSNLVLVDAVVTDKGKPVHGLGRSWFHVLGDGHEEHISSFDEGTPPSTQILFQARVLPASDPRLEGTKLPEGPAGEMTTTLKGKVQRTIVDLHVDPRSLTFVETQSGIRQAQIELTLVAYDGEGKRVNYLDHGIQLNLKPEQYSRIMGSDSAISLRESLNLPAGQMSLRIVVYDPATVRVGSLEAPVRVVAE
jgi:hypothetical protein